MPIPDKNILLQFETSLWQDGFTSIGGIDEAGRGPLAGPVVSACVVFKPDFFIEGVYDSKALSAAKRETLFKMITENCVSYAVGICDHAEIDRINIYEASKLSMIRAVEGMDLIPDHLLIDAVKLKTDIPSTPIIKGDQKSFTIAAASIIAKVTRDRMMQEMHKEFPEYGWNRNKGYPTEEHREAVKKFGQSPYHRRSFKIT